MHPKQFPPSSATYSNGTAASHVPAAVLHLAYVHIDAQPDFLPARRCFCKPAPMLRQIHVAGLAAACGRAKIRTVELSPLHTALVANVPANDRPTVQRLAGVSI